MTEEAPIAGLSLSTAPTIDRQAISQFNGSSFSFLR
jgi:hypothetical protein